MMAVTVGETFDTFVLLQERIDKLQEEENIALWKRDSRTIEKARAKGLKRHMKEELQYYSLQYACYHGGRQFKSRSEGVRPNHRSVQLLALGSL